MPSKPILAVDDQPEVRTTLFETLTRAGHAVDLARDGEEALVKFQACRFELVISDIQMPRLDGMNLMAEIKRSSPDTPVILMSGAGTISQAVEAMKCGASDYLLKPFSGELLTETVGRVLRSRPDNWTFNGKTRDREEKSGKKHIITQNAGMKRVLDMAASVAPSRATVLISGESGTGKELLARFIHQHSDRAQGPFVAVNCAALPEGLLESELFGHEKGSFTGAITRKIGKFELANLGTIMLDEISEMDLGLQAKLLRVLQEGEVDRVGGKEPVPLDVRVIATTNRDLFQWVGQGQFRQDLFYRLNVIPLSVPPLRDRIGDIPLLTRYFLDSFSRETGKKPKSLSAEALNTLKTMTWPGNVRELENIIARGFLLARDDVVGLMDLFLGPEDRFGAGLDKENPAPDAARRDDGEEGDDDSPGRTMTIREMEKALIGKALRQTDGNRTHAAKALGISVRTLRNKLAEYKNEKWAGQAA